MKKKHYVNLTNGIEAIKKLKLKNYNFIRIQSTACEQKRWNDIIMDLDNDFLMNLALGNKCIVYDYSNKDRVPRAIRQGVEFIKYMLERIWFDRRIECEQGMHNYFEDVYRNELETKVKNKIKYYRKFLKKDKIYLDTVVGKTTHDGDYDYYAGFLYRA